MAKVEIMGGTVHKLPPDLNRALAAHPRSLRTWETITPLARNEWICWIESVKKAETRKEHFRRALVDLGKGKRRPCCWMGCIHRTDKPMSSSQRFILARKAKKR